MVQLSLTQLVTFYWVAKLGSFQAAAEHLHTTQPGVSTRIRLLEEALGVRLLDRSARGAQPTPRGRVLVDYAQRMMGLADTIRQEVGDQRAVAGRIRLGVADTIALTWLPEFLARARNEFPRLEIEVEINLTAHLLRQLQERSIDFAFAAAPIVDSSLEFVPLARFAQGWYAAPTVLPKRRRFTPEQLAELPIITHTRGTHQHQTILRWFRAAGLEPRRLSTCSSLATIIRLTVAGLGISILSPAVVRREVAAGEIVPIAATKALPPQNFLAVLPTVSPVPSASAAVALAIAVSAGRSAPGAAEHKGSL